MFSEGCGTTLGLKTICSGPGGPVTSITSTSFSECSLITETLALLTKVDGILVNVPKGLAGVDAARGGVITMPELRFNTLPPCTGCCRTILCRAPLLPPPPPPPPTRAALNLIRSTASSCQATSSSLLNSQLALILISPVRRKEARTETEVIPRSGNINVTSSFRSPPFSLKRWERKS